MSDITNKIKAMQLKKAMHTQLAFLVLMMTALATAASANYQLALPGCDNICGNVSIPYPFGTGTSSKTGENCFLDKTFYLSCLNNSRLNAGNTQVLSITLHGQLELSFPVSRVCYDSKAGSIATNGDNLRLRIGPSSPVISRQNKFISVGCDTYGYLNSFRNGSTYSTGCLSRCYNSPYMENAQVNDGRCSGIGCCQVDIPPRMRNISILTSSFNNFNQSFSFSNCSYSFIAKKGFYKFSVRDLQRLPYVEAPMIVDWAVGKGTCKTSQGRPGFACKNNSYCDDKDTDGYGYRCKCKDGYDGNPYHPNGCIDINECTTKKHNCISDDNCRNLNGSFECFCPKRESGDGTVTGGCHRKNRLIKIVIGAVAGFMALFFVTSWLCIIYQRKRKLTEQKEKFFRQNGGLILQQQLSATEDSSKTVQIFTADELKKATNNYHENLSIGSLRNQSSQKPKLLGENIINSFIQFLTSPFMQEPFMSLKCGLCTNPFSFPDLTGREVNGTIFNGFLRDNRVVAIKNFKLLDQSQIEQFINEMIAQSRIDHKNVVKLMGCCLETEVPLLVHEFVNNGTLLDFIHNKSKEANDVPWETRLRIATEAAGALSYLHSATSTPFIHRDVKSANILLDDTLTAKVSHFGASRLIPTNEIELATMVQETIGYLDPEYMQTSKLTKKSEVYSFGVVLAELLTGEKAFSFERPEEKRSLAMYFLFYLKENRLFEILQVDIVNEENKEEIKKVAFLAMKCLRLNGEERPSMKEVAMELEGIRQMEKHPWINTSLNLPQEAASGIYEHGDSSGHQNTAFDSMKDHVLTPFGDGR